MSENPYQAYEGTSSHVRQTNGSVSRRYPNAPTITTTPAYLNAPLHPSGSPPPTPSQLLPSPAEPRRKRKYWLFIMVAVSIIGLFSVAYAQLPEQNILQVGKDLISGSGFINPQDGPLFGGLFGANEPASVEHDTEGFESFTEDAFTPKTTSVKVSSEIPGGSPLELCLDDEPQLADIELLQIDPNPPVPATNLTVYAEGTLKEDLVDGAYVDVLVRYGFITLVNQRYDLCELLPEVDMECPVKAGKLSLQRDVELPENVPPGTYWVDVKAYNVDDRLLTCLTGSTTIDA